MTREQWIGLWLVGSALAVLVLVALWPGILAVGVQSDVIRTLGLVVPLAGAFLLWRARKIDERDRAEKAQEERRRRILVALRAELMIAAEAHAGYFAADRVAAVEATMLANLRSADTAKGERSMPGGSGVRSNIVFDGVREEIADLPAELIAPIVRYYGVDQGIVEMLNGFAEGKYEALPIDRREAAITAFFAIGKDALDLAARAYLAVDDEVTGRNAALAADPEDRARIAALVTSDDNDGSGDRHE